MLEKKSVVDGLTLNYTGTFDIEEFYKTVEDWREFHRREKEIKKKLEKVTTSGKSIEWSVELWREIDQHNKFMTRVKALFSDVTEIESKKEGYNKRLQKGHALIILDAFLESDYHHEWIMKPWIYFLRAVFDRYVYNFWTERYVSKLRAETYDLHKTMNAFFHLYPYRR